MKPRLASAPLTQEDLDAIDMAFCRSLRGHPFGDYVALYAGYVICDRRDAELMRMAAFHHGRRGPLLHWSPEQPDYTYEYIWFGGARLGSLEADVGSLEAHARAARNITYFA
jgi:hypothetical protein